MSTDRELDVVLYGATGFVGRLVAEYLATNAPEGARIGLAGRSRDRLEAVRTTLGAVATDWPVREAEADDATALAALAASARVVATTVGPYRRYGLPLVEACAAAGTHYADLTGEVLFMRDSIDRAHAAATSSGARIVHGCGFDSIPSDLGVLLLHEAARGDGAGELEDTAAVFTSLRGGVSGGTVASLSDQVDEIREAADLRKLVEDPYSLSPDRAAEPDLGDERDPTGVVHDDQLGTWTAPFVMATINTRVVRRSNALAGYPYGRSFRYREVMGTGPGLAGRAKATGVAGGLAAMMAGLDTALGRKALDKVLPDPGQGPSEETRRKGHFTCQLHARAAGGRRYRARVAGRGDPGYAATAVMFGESALCLALDGDRLPGAAGVLTPATAMGLVLVDRLRRAGMTLEAGPDT